MKREWNDTEEIHEHQSLLRRPSKKEVFNGYYFDKKVKIPEVLPTYENRIDEVEEFDSPANTFQEKDEDNILAKNIQKSSNDESTKAVASQSQS